MQRDVCTTYLHRGDVVMMYRWPPHASTPGQPVLPAPLPPHLLIIGRDIWQAQELLHVDQAELLNGLRQQQQQQWQ